MRRQLWVQPPACWEDVQSEQTAMSRGSWGTGDRGGGTTHSIAAALVDLQHQETMPETQGQALVTALMGHFPRLPVLRLPNHLCERSPSPADNDGHWAGCSQPRLYLCPAALWPRPCPPEGPHRMHEVNLHEMQESGVQSSDTYHFPTSSWLSFQSGNKVSISSLIYPKAQLTGPEGGQAPHQGQHPRLKAPLLGAGG